MKAWTNPGKWSVNPMNFSEEVTKDFELPERVYVLDSTLRKMVETAGCNWSVDGAVEIARMADAIGVEFMVVNIVYGWKPPSPKLLQMFESVAKLKRRFKLFGTAWLTKESADVVLDHGGDGVDFTRGDSFRFVELCDYVRGRGGLVAKELSVDSRLEHVPPSEIARQANEVLTRDLAYIGIHENKGPTTPEAWRYYMKQIRKELLQPTILIPHIHNMFGTASAATCAAVTGGANGVDVTVNGIATDAGLGALEEVVTALEVWYGVDTGVRLEMLREYSQLVSRVTGLPVHYNKPIVGDAVFLCETDPYVREVLQARYHGGEAIRMIAPSLVGQQYAIVWGANTIDETNATKEKLFQIGLPADEASARRVNDAIRAELERRNRPPLYLTEPEVEELAHRVLGDSQPARGAP